MSERRGTKALELWCRRVTEGYSGVKIDNMTTSWRDGLAFCAMIHHFRPDLIDFDKLNKSDVYYNNALAFTTAEKYLGIPALLDADDMAAYQVPDRLSILTYLSQFFQVFGSQDAHNNRLKRTSSSATGKTQLTKSSGPPSKMAHVVGVPKREPCRKCQLPVFLAERLMVGKKVYHRTCLKCARCDYQLTPGSFYETEIDEQYCCETCPDEEESKKSDEVMHKSSEIITALNCSDVQLRNQLEREVNDLSPTAKFEPNSIKERLAFFENCHVGSNVDKQLLQKSLSDEEKSKSLHRMESSKGKLTATFKSNAALSSFLNKTVNDEEEDLSEKSFSIQNYKMGISNSEEDDTNDLTIVSLPPELPKSLPPLQELNDKKQAEESKRFVTSTQLVLDSSNKITSLVKVDNEQNVVQGSAEKIQSIKLQNNFSSNIKTDKTNNNNTDNEEQASVATLEIETILEPSTERTIQLHEISLENNLEFSEINYNDCVNKDKDVYKIITGLEATKAEEITIEHMQQLDEHLELNNENEAHIKNTFELCTKTEGKVETASEAIEDTETTKRLSVVRARLQQFGTIKSIDNDSTSLQACNNTTMSTRIENIKVQKDYPKSMSADNKVPLTIKPKENDSLENNLDYNKDYLEETCSTRDKNDIQEEHKTTIIKGIEEYPDDLNPFKSDEEDDRLLDGNKENFEVGTAVVYTERGNLNPFDSSDDEVELEKLQNLEALRGSATKIPPPRPPPPRFAKNPFSNEDEENTYEKNFHRQSSCRESQIRRTPVPTPRSIISQSRNPTPEPTPRLSAKISSTRCPSNTPNKSSLASLKNSSDIYGSVNSLHSNNGIPYNLLRNSDIRSSNNSLNLSSEGTIRSRKSRRAPLPPATVKELFPSNETVNSSSKTSTPSSSTVGTPKSGRKKRHAPAPPKPSRLESIEVTRLQIDAAITRPKNLNSYPLQSELDSKWSDEEKALLEGKTSRSLHSNQINFPLSTSRRSSKRLIPLDKELLEEHGFLQHSEEINGQCDDFKQKNQQNTSMKEENEPNIVYRRILIPQNLETPTREYNPLTEDLNRPPSLGERQLEKLKDNKEANNRNRQSQISATSSGADDNDPLFNKSAHGKWKRRKGPAPALPIPPRKVLQMLPLQEIKHELEIIEVQQQGLEKQGVILEKMIRDRCEGENGEPLKAGGTPSEGEDTTFYSCMENSKEVENLILQLFELVNEKNELFRRQAELMYLRRQHRLEQEQADLEYEIRTLMAQPERNKTDSDKAKEEALIERLVEIVQLRNEVVECLEMDRIREAEEDHSIKQRLESHIAKREGELNTRKSPIKLSKKEKKKQKEAKKLSKCKIIDADKDADESELSLDKQKPKKKKKLIIF